MLVLPLLFVFAVFSSMQAASINAAISASGIEILGKPEDNTYRIDLADYDNAHPEYAVKAEVQPQMADQSYEYKIEYIDSVKPVEEDDPPIKITSEGGIQAFAACTARVFAVSKDGGYKDSVTVIVGSSKPYDFDLSLTAGGENCLTWDGNAYNADLMPGKYGYSTQLIPSGFVRPTFGTFGRGEGQALGYHYDRDFFVIDEGAGTILLPFSGENTVDVNVRSGFRGGDLTKKLKVNVSTPDVPMLVNGASDLKTITLGKIVGDANEGTQDYSDRATVYVQTQGTPLTVEPVSQANEIVNIETREIREGSGQYIVEIEFAKQHRDNISMRFTGGGTVQEIEFLFEDLTLELRSDLPGQNADPENATILVDQPISFTVVPTGETKDVGYRWFLLVENGSKKIDLSDPVVAAELKDQVEIEVNREGTVCTITVKTLAIAFEGSEYSTFVLHAQAGYITGFIADEEEREHAVIKPFGTVVDGTVNVKIIRQVTSIQLEDTATKAATSLAGRATVAGLECAYNEQNALAPVAARYPLGAVANRVSETLEMGVEELDFTTSDGEIAKIEVDEAGKVWLVPQGKGKDGALTITAAWKGNADFGQNIRATLTLDVASNAVRVTNSKDLYAVADHGGYPIVLGADIMLGSDGVDEAGQPKPLPVEERRALIANKTMRSTYNTEYYKNNSAHTLEDAKVRYAIEFKKSVYGNGYTLNAEYISNAADGSGVPYFFRGPLFFVSYGEVASVAGQDNISFLVRTKGVTLHNLTLLGCSDSSLLTAENQYDLTKLNNVGTTLEINEDVNVVNCRIRNGRNVVRVYGGNRDGDRYFLDTLNNFKGFDSERIKVTSEGSIISQGREFLLKEGANHALRARSSLGGAEPELPKPELTGGNLTFSATEKCKVQSNDYLSDEAFYRAYVLTDLTLRDSVLETSGFFTVGVESNFAGQVLYQDTEYTNLGFDGWAGTGGTSFASVLRLEGAVRFYDWKEVSHIDSSTLITANESVEVAQQLKLDVAEMIRFVCDHDPKCANILDKQEEGSYVHGGIAFYGGGRNYSQLDISKLIAERSDLSEFRINIDVLKDDTGNTGHQGEILPLAAGTQDFRFYMYGKDSKNNFAAQKSDAAAGSKYTGIAAKGAFALDAE